MGGIRLCWMTRARNLACALPSSGDPGVASVPVTARGETPAADPGGETGGPGDGTGGTGGTDGTGGTGGTGGGGDTGGDGAFGLPTIPGRGSDFGAFDPPASGGSARSEEHTSELQSLMRLSYAVFCLKKKSNQTTQHNQKKEYRD